MWSDAGCQLGTSTLFHGKSRYTWAKLRKAKDEVTEAFKDFALWFKTQHEKPIKKLHSDNGGEFISHELKRILSNAGVEHAFTEPYSPQSNWIAERMNQTLMNKVRAMLNTAGLGDKFSGEALLQAVQIQNVIPSRTLKNQTPYEILKGTKPNLKEFKVFGCRAFMHVPKEKRKKLEAKYIPMIYMGRQERQLYRLFNSSNRKLLFSRSMHCDETVFPGFPERKEKARTETKAQEEGSDSADSMEYTDFTDSDSETSLNPDINLGHDTVPEVDITRNETNVMLVKLRLRAPRRSSRARRAPNRLRATLVAQKKTENRDEPSLKLAMNSNDKSEWITAITTELNELKERGTWVLVPRPERTKILPCKIVLKIKRRPDNTIEKCKARLVALGCLQSIRDCDQTFSAVIDFTTVRLALSIAGIEGSQVYHIYVTGAFL